MTALFTVYSLPDISEVDTYVLSRTCNCKYLPLDDKPTQQSTLELVSERRWHGSSYSCCDLAPRYCMSVQALLLEAMTLGYNSSSDASMPGTKSSTPAALASTK